MAAMGPVFQFKITLRYVTPRVWRKIQISDSVTFWDLHAAIQDAMGWSDYHLHQFEFPNSIGQDIGIPMPDYHHFDNMRVLASWDEQISDYFSEMGDKCHYRYDFGDSWDHLIEFEGIHERVSDVEYPRCLGGKNACPPEDVGGSCGFEEFVKIMNNKEHKDYQEMLSWYGRVFDPKEFSPKDVSFVSHEEVKQRFKIQNDDHSLS